MSKPYRFINGSMSTILCFLKQSNQVQATIRLAWNARVILIDAQLEVGKVEF